MSRKILLPVACIGSILLMHLNSSAQGNTKRHLPIIDVHVHAMKMNPAFAADMCPWFLSDMPGGDLISHRLLSSTQTALRL